MNFYDFELMMKIKEKEELTAQELIEDVSSLEIKTAWELLEEEND